MSPVWFEDIPVGGRAELGSYTFSEDEIIAFARAFDPQPFHMDRAAAERSPYGGLIASGWHTACVWMKLMIAHRKRAHGAAYDLRHAAISPGFRDLKWLKPVRPGMTLSYSSEITAKLDWPSRPHFGLIESMNEARDEQGELVISFVGRVLFPRRPK